MGVTKKIVIKHHNGTDWDIVYPKTTGDQIIQDSDHRLVTDAEKATWNAKEPAITKNTAFNKNFGTTAGTVVEGDKVGNTATLNTTSKVVVGSINEVHGEVDAIDTRLTTAEGNISSNDTDISNLQSGKANITYVDSTFVPLTQRAAADGVATLGSDGKIPTNQLPALAINDTFVVATEVAMLALTAQKGDIAIRTDTSQTFILATDDPTLLVNWKEALTPADGVLSVTAGTGLAGGTITDSGTIAVNFAGNGVADTSARSDHNHDAAYLGISANAVSATKLQTARNIALGGDVTGSANFDGTGNITITATVGDDSHLHNLDNLTEGTTNKFLTTTLKAQYDAAAHLSVGAAEPTSYKDLWFEEV